MSEHQNLEHQKAKGRIHWDCALFFNNIQDFVIVLSTAIQRHLSIDWWAHLDSNQGPTGYEPVALPAEL
jgi:hypothetical protein